MLRIVEDVVQSMCHGSLGLQAPAAAADIFYAMWRSARGEVVVLGHGMTGYETPVAGCSAEAYPYGARSAWISAIGGLWSVEGKEWDLCAARTAADGLSAFGYI